MSNHQEIHVDFQSAPLAIDLVKSRRLCLTFLLLALVCNFFSLILGYFFIYPCIIACIIANFYYHRGNPGLNYTQKVVAEFIGLFLMSLPRLFFVLMEMRF